MRLGLNIWTFLLTFIFVLLLGFVYFRYTSSKFSLAAVLVQDGNCSLFSFKTDIKPAGTKELHFPRGTHCKQASTSNSRPDIVSTSPWLTPIVWEGTFDLPVIDAIYKHQNITVATTVFALGKYVMFLKDFLETAEQHFFVGYHVNYYLFTDRPQEVPEIKLGAEHYLTIINTASSNRWQEITMGRMERIEKLIEERLINEADYIFSLDVDTKFHSHWGAETLSDIIAVIHPGYYGTQRSQFPFERRPESQAYIPMDEGDYYYIGAVLGGRVDKVLKLVKACRIMLDVDRASNIEAAWQEESHLNKYFLYNKPSKLLSPEYLWQDFKKRTPNIKVIRLSHVIKNYAAIRPNS